MNVQTVPFMPTRELQGPANSMITENRADKPAFSKELERRIDDLKAGIKDPKLGQKPAKGESKQDSVADGKAEKKNAKEPESKELQNKEQSKTQTGESRLVKKQATKQERLKKFMDSLESEFQIPPTRIVEAFSQLTPQELSLPADQSIGRVVENLDLDGESMAKVQNLYGDLVKDLESIDASKLDSSGAAQFGSTAAALGLVQQRFDKMQNQKMALQKSLDQMNQSFWQPQMIPVTASPNPEALSGAVMAARNRGGLESYKDLASLSASAESSDLMGMDDLGLERNPEMIINPRTGEIFNPQQNNANPYQAQAQGDSSEQSAAALAALGITGLAAETESSQAMQNMNNSYTGMDKTKLMAMNSKSGSMGNQMDILSGANPMEYSTAMLNKFSDSSGSSGGGAKDFFSHSEKGSQATKTQVNGKKVDGDEMKGMLASLGIGNEIKDNTAPIAAPIKGEIPREVADQNIQSVMKQAQYLVKNGGGEMKVRMTPEGLGEIQLRVELKEGRVQLHMLADNKETKKMLESSVSDLKDSLASQKISLDSVKIDSVVRTNVENQTQGNLNGQNQNQNLHQGQDQRDTRQFWNQFQDQFGGRPNRDAMFETPKPKSYAPKDATTLGPAESTTASVRSNGKSKGLNLVA